MTRLFEEPFEGCKGVSYFGLRPLYYKPEKFNGIMGEELETIVSYREYIEYLFVGFESLGSIYGYYTGLVALNHMNGTTQVPVVQEIRTNKVKETVEYMDRGIRFKLYPSDIEISVENFRYLQVLDIVDNLYDYFDEDVVKVIKNIVDTFKLELYKFELHFNNFGEKTKEVILNVFA